MFDPLKLIDAMPFSGMEPECIGLFHSSEDSGVPALSKRKPWWVPSPTLVESSTSERLAYAFPHDWLRAVCYRCGMTPEGMNLEADRWLNRARRALPEDLWIPQFNWCSPEKDEAVPAIPLLDWMGREGLLPPALVGFFQAAVQESLHSVCFESFDGKQALRWRVTDRPDRPPPHMMVQFSPSAAWTLDEEWGDLQDPQNLSNPFLTWRDSIREVADRIEAATGEPPYDFCDLKREYEDDFIHRFLVLHWLCTFRPQSAYVQHMCRASGAEDLDEFMGALINPKSYTVPYRNAGFFCICEVSGVRFTYPGPGGPVIVAPSWHSTAVPNSPELRPRKFRQTAK